MYTSSTPMDDAELLQRYAQSHSEPAFAELVRRHVDLVFSAALRQVGGDPHRAEEVTQMVFISLARKASSLARHPVLLAWLHQSTRFAAGNVRREEIRRWTHERAAAAENAPDAAPDERGDWERLRPVLDEAVNELNRPEREAVLLRFFANRPFAEVGQKLGLSENAARMRVERALAKLQSGLARRGITSTAAALSVALTGNAVLAAPAGIAASATSAALAGAGGLGGGATLIHLMSSIKLPAGIAGLVLAAGIAGVVWQQEANARVQGELTAFSRQTGISGVADGLGQIVSLRSENQRLTAAAAVVADLRAANAAGGSRAAAPVRTRAAAPSTPPGQIIYDPSQLDQPVTPTYQARPQYPSELKSEGSSGQSLVEFTILTDGTVADLKPMKSSEQGFEDAATAAVQHWRFKPGTVGGQKVNSRAQVPIVFTLQGDSASWF
jgi:RNA polymerase sigma factor (sigma-70 family)